METCVTNDWYTCEKLKYPRLDACLSEEWLKYRRLDAGLSAEWFKYPRLDAGLNGEWLKYLRLDAGLSDEILQYAEISTLSVSEVNDFCDIKPTWQGIVKTSTIQWTILFTDLCNDGITQAGIADIFSVWRVPKLQNT